MTKSECKYLLYKRLRLAERIRYLFNQIHPKESCPFPQEKGRVYVDEIQVATKELCEVDDQLGGFFDTYLEENISKVDFITPWEEGEEELFIDRLIEDYSEVFGIEKKDQSAKLGL